MTPMHRHPGTLRAVSHRIPARRRRQDRAVRLAVRAKIQRRVHSSHRRHGSRTLQRRDDAGHPRSDDLAWADLGRRAVLSIERLDLYRAAALRLLGRGQPIAASAPPARTIAPAASAEHRMPRARRSASGCRMAPSRSMTKSWAKSRSRATRSKTSFCSLRQQPTYHLSVVVDDSDMRITHVMRGADHISNTPKQILLYRALGHSLPVFAHLPLILGPDKTRMSKRHGATSVMAYKEQGILPEALRNFLASAGLVAGHRSGDVRRRELIKFSLEGISKANAVFNPDKLAWFNAQYMARLPHEGWFII